MRLTKLFIGLSWPLFSNLSLGFCPKAVGLFRRLGAFFLFFLKKIMGYETFLRN
jgi:hypothetical protein